MENTKNYKGKLQALQLTAMRTSCRVSKLEQLENSNTMIVD